MFLFCIKTSLACFRGPVRGVKRDAQEGSTHTHGRAYAIAQALAATVDYTIQIEEASVHLKKRCALDACYPLV